MKAETSVLRPDALLIGAGQPLRGDDGAGPAVVYEVERRLPARLRPPVRVAQWRGDPAALLDLWSGYRQVILVDAVQTGAEAGRLHRWDFAGQAPPASFGSVSTHGLGLAAAIELARALGSLPPGLVIYGIEASRFEAGAGLSPPVRAAVARCRRQVLAELEQTCFRSN